MSLILTPNLQIISKNIKEADNLTIFVERELEMFSVIIPVYNRPSEVDELLESLMNQQFTDFDVIVVEDGSSVSCRDIVDKYSGGEITIKYLFKENGGPALARNFGAKESDREYLIFLDSDAILPQGYFAAITEALKDNPVDLFGGADRSHPNFTPLQKAIDYSMTSIITTGGIRGNKKSADKFYPRSFNMGIKRLIFNEIGGFSNMRFGEDVDFSYKVAEGDYTTAFFQDAWVYHKRRNTFRTFFKQVFNSGIARIHLTLRHRGTLKLVHLLPTAFFLGSLLLILIAFVALFINPLLSLVAISPLVLLSVTIFLDALRQGRGVRVAILSIVTSFIQLTGYGSGLVIGWWNIIIKGNKDYAAFRKNFYK